MTKAKHRDDHFLPWAMQTPLDIEWKWFKNCERQENIDAL